MQVMSWQVTLRAAIIVLYFGGTLIKQTNLRTSSLVATSLSNSQPKLLVTRALSVVYNSINYQWFTRNGKNQHRVKTKSAAFCYLTKNTNNLR